MLFVKAKLTYKKENIELRTELFCVVTSLHENHANLFAFDNKFCSFFRYFFVFVYLFIDNY